MKRGYRKPRKIRPVEKDVPKGYDSGWEYQLHNSVLKSWNHHSDKINYIVEHKYEPDFTQTIDGVEYLLEAKGRFWDFPEYSKYVHIKKALPKHIELVFFFQKPFAPMPGAKVRKNKTKRTHAEWAETNGFRWFSEANLPEKEWLNNEI